MNIDTETVIVNLLKEDKKTYLSVKRLLKLICFIYDELSEKFELNNYQLAFDFNFDSIERTVLYNNNVFELDIDGEIIYLRESKSVESLVTQYPVDDRVTELIREFKNRYAA